MIFRLIIVIFFSTSCTSLYIPSARNVPLLANKNEFQGAVSTGNGTNVQVAYSPLNHIGLYAGVLYANNRYLGDDNFRRHSSFEIATGYYKKKKYSFEVMAGYGRGGGHGRNRTFGLFIFPSVPETAEGYYSKLFIQPAIGMNIRKVQLALSGRVSYVDFTNVRLTMNDNPVATEITPLYFAEPSFTFKFHTTRRLTSVFIFAQTGLNIPLHNDETVFVKYSLLHYNAGVGVRINRKYF